MSASLPVRSPSRLLRHGEAEWRTADGRYQLHPRQFVLLNDQQPYTITVESKTPVETFCIFFERGFSKACASFRSASNSQLPRSRAR